MSPLLTLVAEDKQLITYRPKLNKITGSVTATILLQQILFHWKSKKGQPFYKFKEPCNHERYKKGDSWEEEIGFSRKEFDTAIKKIGYKIGKNKNFKEKKKQETFVWFRTDSQRVTWYEVNEKALEKALNEIYLVTTEWGDSYRPNGALANDRMGRYYNTENTTENTTKITSAKQTENSEKDNEANPITDTKPILRDTDTKPILRNTETNDKADILQQKAEHSRTYFLDIIHTETNTNTNTNFKETLIAELKKEIFVAGQAKSKIIDDMDDKDFYAFYDGLSSDDVDYLHPDYWRRFGSMELDAEPPKVNRSLLRRKHKINLAGESFYDFLDYRNGGFGGKADIVDAYVKHEMALWDFKKMPLKDAELFFQKEICLGHPVAKHYLDMTPEQRSQELASHVH